MEGAKVTFNPCICTATPIVKQSKNGQYLYFGIKIITEDMENGEIIRKYQNYSIICFDDHPSFNKILEMKMQKDDYLTIIATINVRIEKTSAGEKYDLYWFKAEDVRFILLKSDMEELRRLKNDDKNEIESSNNVLNKFRS